MTLWELSASDATARIREGRITSVDLTKACLERIDETDAQLRAWAHIDAENALAQAEAMDDLRRRGRPIGALHGIPVGIKDIYDTADMPTALGSPPHAGRQPDADAAVIERLREAGAVILGKTVTTPLAFASPSATRNPHNLDHSPGGSSSGSAAGVAAGHMPLALGSQTGGSVNRPASYCGVYGFKPTRGLISRRGALQTSQTLDQVGGFARHLEDLALLSDALTGYDAADPACHTRPKPRTHDGFRADPPVEPVFAVLDTQVFKGSDAMQAGLEEVITALNGRIEHIPPPISFEDVLGHHQVIHEYEFVHNLDGDPAIAPDHTDAIMKAIIERGRSFTDAQYHEALRMVARAEETFVQFFNDYDAILCPSALGEAPLFSENTTGDPVCQKIWTFAGLPSLTLPLLKGETGLPMGVQLIAAQEEDDRLFRTARWLETHLSQPDTQAA